MGIPLPPECPIQAIARRALDKADEMGVCDPRGRAEFVALSLEVDGHRTAAALARRIASSGRIVNAG
jgi:hypothetical protein